MIIMIICLSAFKNQQCELKKIWGQPGNQNQDHIKEGFLLI